MLPYGRQSIDSSDLAAVSESLNSGWLTTGPKVSELENAFATRLGAKHAVAVNNATAALHLAMLVAGIGPGDRVITSPNTFLASANAAAFVGATPDFSDIDPTSYNLCPKMLATHWKNDTKAVVAVDYAGQTAEMPAIAEVAKNKGAIVIEDACHAVGGQFSHNNEIWKVGGHRWADMTTLSFHPVKTMTTGEGGMLVTNNDEYACRARLLRTHGMVRTDVDYEGLGDAGFSEQGPWYYEMQELGYNYRITDFQCALGLSQLERLDSFISRRRQIVAAYNAAFSDISSIQTPVLRNQADEALTSWHLYTLQIDFQALKTTRTQFMLSLREAGIGSQVLYIPVHLQPWYRKTYGYEVGKCPVAEQFYLRTLSLPLYPELTDDEVQLVIKHVMELATR